MTQRPRGESAAAEWGWVEPSWPWGEEYLRVAIGGVVAPLCLGAVVATSLEGDAVGPTDPRAGESVRLMVVSAVGDLPGDVPTYLGGLLKAAVDWGTEIRCPEASLRGCVTDYRDTVADDSGSERGAVRVPVLSGERSE